MNSNYDFEGMFLDMTFWPEVCYCASCRKRYKKETGRELPRVIDWQDKNWKEYVYKRDEWMAEYAIFATNCAKQIKPNVTIEHQFSRITGSWIDGSTEMLTEAVDYAGGDYYGGFLQQTFINKYYKNVSPNLPFVYHTSRCDPELVFHTTTKTTEEMLLHVITALVHRALSEEGINGYKNSVNFWLQENPKIVDSPEKASALSELFENSTVALIYGAAGTGKTTMIDHISSFFNDEKKIYLANTNPAVDNLKQKVHASNCDYYTIAKFKSYSHHDTECEILIIDECSTVSNADMRMILNKASFNLLILVGDVFQIESITFGNWFDLARAFIPKTSVFELEHPYRSKNKELLNVWKKVRNLDDDILEYFARNDYSINLDGSIFQHSDNDEIILCLNYDGLYGINNINKFLQGNNPNRAVQWGVQIYKVGDPILFNESNRFHPLIYNNSKGKIVGIDAEKDKIFFEIELDRPLNEWQARGYDFELINDEESPNSTIRFYVNKYKSTDDDDDGTSEAIVPFQIAYAISIHKAQGLEYNSVKIVITNEVDELVTHNIFYTAITRAKNNLKIYWTPETENKILKSFSKKTMGKDVAILSSKNNIKRVK